MPNFVPQNILSNFLTHSYFDLLEQLCQYPSFTTTELSPPKELMKALKSFLFIFQNNSRNTHLLQETIFNYYEPYQGPSLNLSRSMRPFYKKTLTFKNIKKVYHKTILTAKLHHNYALWDECNTAYIKLHRQLAYHFFDNACKLPPMLKASTSKDFILNSWLYYIDILIGTKAYDTLLSITHSFYSNPFDNSTYLITYIHSQVNALHEQTPHLAYLKKELEDLSPSKKSIF